MSEPVVSSSQAIQWRSEWSPSQRVWMRWPYRRDIWPDAGKAVHAEVRELLSELAQRNIPVALQVHPEEPMPANLSDNVQVHRIAFGDIWLRDCAPFIDQKGGVALHYDFDGWGGIDDQQALDGSARDWLSHTLNLKTESHDWVIEGGALHHDGEGTAIACAGSILHRPSNQGLTDRILREHLQQAFAIEKLLMLPGKLSADETGGHVDNLACFIRPGEVVVAHTGDPSHPDYATCRRVYDFLANSTDAQGRPIKVHTLPLPRSPRLSAAEAVAIAHRPGVRKRIAGMQLMASYVNFLRVRYADGDLIVMPAFGLPSDEKARDQMQQLMPETEVILAPARHLLVGGGGWHCATFPY
ncbi:agmatine deiminase family protein [Aliidiomarina indica]|uniref:agmatine deiminase family protein n=1 Tax=Aliidiomarina indica TaxID=2749147 RepID=UPI00188F2DE8|nr:agmatine deiminase family protein [Aliidiomarina indica]